MKSIILFRFHRNLDVCLNKLALLKKFNPEIEIYGLYGGPTNDPENLQEKLKGEVKSIFSFADKPDDWKWKNGDLATRMWYQKVGKDIAFDRLYSIEWDILFCESLEKTYQHIPADTLGLTALTPLSLVEKEWSWTREDKPVRQKWLDTLAFVKEKYGYSQNPFASLGPGACFPRLFLEKYAEIEVPEMCHEELRLPLFAQILGIPLQDTGFYKKWFYPPERKYFNCRGEEVLLSTVKEELAKPDGRRVFHPVREIFQDS